MKDKIKILSPLDQHEDPKTIWRKYYEDGIRDDLDTLRFMSEEIGTFQRIRETFFEHERIKNLCEDILKELKERFQLVRENIENARREIRKLG